MSEKSVLIVGAGIGGLATSAALAQAGYDVTIIELHQSLRSSTYGVGIIQQPNQLRALDVIGCAEACIEQGYPAENASKHLDQAGNVTRVIRGPRIDGFDSPGMNGITRPRLHKILTDKALSSGVSIEYGKTITGIEQFDDRAEVGISDGTTRSVSLVVGADGVRSVVRTYVYDEVIEPKYSGKSVVRVNIPRLPEIDAILRQEAVSETGERIGVGFVPLAPDLAYMYVNIRWDRSVRLDATQLKELLRAELAPFGGPAGVARDQLLDGGEEVILRPEEWVMAPAPWHRGRIVLIGDAVHSVTPNTAQGAALAIEDGIVLTESLLSEESVEAALHAYVERRFDRCRRVVEYGVKSREWEFNPTPDFNPIEEGIRMRESVASPF